MSQLVIDPPRVATRRGRLVIHPEARRPLIEAMRFAKSVGALDRLKARLQSWRDRPWFGEDCTTHLFPDFAPFSFAWQVRRDGRVIYNGGLIYHGPGCPGDGSAPSFCVDIGAGDRPTHDWGVHS